MSPSHTHWTAGARYRNIGANMVLTMCMNIVTPHMYWVGSYILHNRNFRKNKDKAIDQKSLNELAIGPPFKIAERLASAFSTFSICLVYSSGLPILLPIGAVAMFTYYWAGQHMASLSSLSFRFSCSCFLIRRLCPPRAHFSRFA